MGLGKTDWVITLFAGVISRRTSVEAARRGDFTRVEASGRNALPVFGEGHIATKVSQSWSLMCRVAGRR
jgi:hypothetical protein